METDNDDVIMYNQAKVMYMEEFVKKGFTIFVGKALANWGIEYVVSSVLKVEGEEKKLVANLIIKGIAVFFLPKYLEDIGEDLALGILIDMIEDVIAYLIRKYGGGGS